MRGLLRLAARAAGGAVGTVAGVAELVSAATSDVTTSADGRVHVPVPGVHLPEAAPAVARLEELLVAHDAVHRAEVNAPVGHVIVVFDPQQLTDVEVARLVEDAVDAAGLAGTPRADRPHPGAAGPLLRESALLAAHLSGLAVTTVAAAIPRPLPLALPAALVAVADATPRVRALVGAALGDPVADTTFTLATAVSNTAGRRPFGLIVDACLRFALHQEVNAQRRAFTAWDSELAAREGAYRAPAVSTPIRPDALPSGPVERVADGTGILGVTAAGALLALGRVNLASAALAAGAAKAARGGRECFAAQLGRDLAGRGSLVVDRGALRRLDRVDTVVLDADVLLTRRQAVVDVLPLASDFAVAELVERAHDLVDPRRPEVERRAGSWSAAPVDPATWTPPQDVPGTVRDEAARLARRSRAVCALRAGTRTVALVAVAEELDPLAEAAVEAAGRAGLVLVAGSSGLAHRLDADGRVDGADVTASVRDLQQRGHVVALVSATSGPALAAADVGIGLVGVDGAPAWSAHVLAHGLAETCALLDAVPAAREASRRSAQLAVAGSVLGGGFAALGPMAGAANRASIPVQTAALLAYGIGTWSAISAARRPPPAPADRNPWHAMSTQAVLDALGTSPEGLSEAESMRRRRDEPGRPTAGEVGLGRAAAEELANPVTPTLMAGAGVSAGMGSLLDPLLIAFVLLVNALIGGVQRLGTQRAVRALEQSTASPVRVLRGGSEVAATSGELAAGDVVVLQAGDAVPADCRILAVQGLEVDESSLTGESALVPKSPAATAAPDLADRHSMLYAGTIVAAGRAEAVVVATGHGTEAGRGLHLQEAPPATGVEVRLNELMRRILPLSVGAGIALAVVDLLRARGLAVATSRAVSLAVAAVPEGLPFVATVAELAAARRLSQRGALVRNPPTIEALGRVGVLCFDKTGTLTEGRIALRGVSDGADTRLIEDTLPEHLREVVATAVRASPFQADGPDVTHQTDRAVLRGARELGVGPDLGVGPVEHLDELPFESHRGYHATLWRAGNRTRVSVKGAPEVVLPLCATWQRADEAEPLDDRARSSVEAEVDRIARQGRRVLAVAEGTTTAAGAADLGNGSLTGLSLRGFVALADPVRPTASAAVRTLHAAGVDVVMITGDHPSTAEAIAAELNVLNGRKVMTGAELDRLGDEQLTERLADTTVFARATPEHKARIVRQLQRGGAAVAVTGDGTNDAPAIRLADVGIALGSRATPAAREAADVVITDDRIETITDAIVEGRGMWSSVRDALSILLGGNLGEIAYTIATGVLADGSPLNARQLLLVNLLTDVLPAMAVAVRPPPDLTPEMLLAEGPEGSLGASLTRDIRFRAAVTATAAAGAWLLARPVSTPGQASTTGLVALVGAQLAQTVAVRGRTPAVGAAAVGSLALLVVAVQVPGISRVVGCRPLLPHQWALGLSASVAAAAAQLVRQRVRG